MIVLIGTQTHLLQHGKITAIDCPKCGQKNSVLYRIFSKYVHLTMIPLFAVGKIFEAECTSCNAVLDYEDFPETDKQHIINQKEIKEAETPFWTYTGIIILIGFIIFGINSYLENKDFTEERIKTPTIGDVYHLKLSNGYYSTIRIDAINKDSVYATQNDYNSYLPYEVDEIDQPENYTKSKVAYSKKELLTLYKTDVISFIKRKG